MIYIKHFFVLCYHFKVTKSEKCKVVGGDNSPILKVLLEWTGNVHFCTICESKFLKIECGP